MNIVECYEYHWVLWKSLSVMNITDIYKNINISEFYEYQYKNTNITQLI